MAPESPSILPDFQLSKNIHHTTHIQKVLPYSYVTNTQRLARPKVNVGSQSGASAPSRIERKITTMQQQCCNQTRAK